MDKEKLLQNAEMIYKEINGKDIMLCKDSLSISRETIQNRRKADKEPFKKVGKKQI